MASYICVENCYISACDDKKYPIFAHSFLKGVMVELKGGYVFNENIDRMMPGTSDEKYYQYNCSGKRYYITEETVNKFFRLVIHKHLEARTFVDEKSLNEFLSNIDGDKVKNVTPVITRTSGLWFFVLYENMEDDK